LCQGNPKQQSTCITNFIRCGVEADLVVEEVSDPDIAKSNNVALGIDFTGLDN
jgi:hypothetical protein